MTKDKEKIFRTIESILTAHGAEKIGVFGSYALDEENPQSDIDVLVTFSQRKSLLDMVGIEQELTETLGIKTDLLTEKFINPYLVDRIMKEMVVIHG